tara:strand:+ start:47 stop:178 length:132 start_codon:yes stop_codon:yes gene_type:complete
MINKIFLTLVLFCIIISCGKKSDPVFKDPEKKVDIQNILRSNV